MPPPEYPNPEGRPPHNSNAGGPTPEYTNSAGTLPHNSNPGRPPPDYTNPEGTPPYYSSPSKLPQEYFYPGRPPLDNSYPGGPPSEYPNPGGIPPHYSYPDRPPPEYSYHGGTPPHNSNPVWSSPDYIKPGSPLDNSNPGGTSADITTFSGLTDAITNVSEVAPNYSKSSGSTITVTSAAVTSPRHNTTSNIPEELLQYYLTTHALNFEDLNPTEYITVNYTGTEIPHTQNPLLVDLRDIVNDLKYGYFSASVVTLFRVATKKNDVHLSQLLRVLPTVVKRMGIAKRLPQFGVSGATFVENAMEALAMARPDVIRAHSQVMTYTLLNRRTMVPPQVNAMFDIMDNTYTAEDALKIVESLTEIEKYPDNLSAYSIAEKLLQSGLFDPLSRIAGTIKERILYSELLNIFQHRRNILHVFDPVIKWIEKYWPYEYPFTTPSTTTGHDPYYNRNMTIREHLKKEMVKYKKKWRKIKLKEKKANSKRGKTTTTTTTTTTKKPTMHKSRYYIKKYVKKNLYKMKTTTETTTTKKTWKGRRYYHFDEESEQSYELDEKNNEKEFHGRDSTEYITGDSMADSTHDIMETSIRVFKKMTSVNPLENDKDGSIEDINDTTWSLKYPMIQLRDKKYEQTISSNKENNKEIKEKNLFEYQLDLSKTENDDNANVDLDLSLSKYNKKNEPENSIESHESKRNYKTDIPDKDDSDITIETNINPQEADEIKNRLRFNDIIITESKPKFRNNQMKTRSFRQITKKLETSSEDDEAYLRANLNDALVHGFEKDLKLFEAGRRHLHNDEINSETDDEILLKGKIYKAMGYKDFVKQFKSEVERRGR
ncbi:unnamed protein product [Leptidea sinapis]|uniref:Uncharacterized protein n=1 Tax=Leptidea sinapis TaxID=189913 RepID=A0A5E4Q7F9_9NEOP|nr:unnamed protein product [Leptidea sinapis]